MLYSATTVFMPELDMEGQARLLKNCGYDGIELRVRRCPDELRAKGVEVEEVDALSTALEAGSAKAVNIVLMARLAKRLDIPREKWIEAIGRSVAPKFVEMNEKAFALGFDS